MEILYLLVKNKKQEEFGIYITHKKNQNIISDAIIYCYVDDNMDFDKIKKGHKIQLDKEFEVIDVIKKII